MTELIEKILPLIMIKASPKIMITIEQALKHAIAVGWCDERFNQLLKENPHNALAELGYEFDKNIEIELEC